MSITSNSLRQKRFAFLPESSVQLIIESKTGEQFSLAVKNGSLTGIGAFLAYEKESHAPFEIGDILPASKIIWDENESSLGRLVVKSLNIERAGLFIGFSCIDGRVPLVGSLTKYMQLSIAENENVFDYESSSKKLSLANFIGNINFNKDLFHKCKDFSYLWTDLHKNNYEHFYSIRHEADKKSVKLSFNVNSSLKRYVSFATYDYFGLAQDERVKEAAIKVIEKVGVGSMGTPPLSGKTTYHEELEVYLSNMLKKEDSFVFSSGFSANVGVLTAILGPEDLAIADIYSHASIHDGLNASKSKVRFFRHNNLDHMEKLLKDNRQMSAGALAVTEGLFSMDGDSVDVKKFCEISKQNAARTFIDEVHSFGILGEKGLGAAHRDNVLDSIDIFVGSLSKGAGTIGGFVAGSKELITWLKGFARAGMFSCALPPSIVAAARTAIEIMLTDTNRRSKLKENIKFFREGLKELGYVASSDPESPIVPVIIGSEEVLGKINKVLLEMGIFVNPVVFPAVPVGQSRLRFSLSTDHNFADLQLALSALKIAMEKNNFTFEKK